MRGTILFMLVMFGASEQAHAGEPVNLRCSLAIPSGTRVIDFTLNETNGTATSQVEGDDPVDGSAVFTATSVRIGSVTIDRVSLAMESLNNDFMVKQRGYPPVSRGQCVLRRVDRAF